MKGFYTLAEAKVIHEAELAAMTDAERAHFANERLLSKFAYALMSTMGEESIEDPVQLARDIQAAAANWDLALMYLPND